MELIKLGITQTNTQNQAKSKNITAANGDMRFGFLSSEIIGSIIDIPIYEIINSVSAIVTKSILGVS